MPYSVYFASPMRYTPWTERPFLERADLIPSEDFQTADIVVAERARFFDTCASPERLNILWTQEPYFDTSATPTISRAGVPVHVFNLYNLNVYLDNFRAAPGRTFWSYGAEEEIHFVFDQARFARRETVILAGYRPEIGLTLNGVEIGLFKYRAALSMALHARGSARIYGKGWPTDVATADSSKGAWWADKPARMAHAAFNLCMENTVFDHFVTEKIWQSIAAGCLPIYYGHSRIYETFPRDSFIDMGQLGSFEALYTLLETMTATAYRDRMHALTHVYNEAIRHDRAYRSHRKTEDAIITFLRTHL